MLEYLDAAFLAAFARKLANFQNRHGLGDFFARLQLDHLAIKMYDGAAYEQALRNIRPFCRHLIEANLDKRRITIAVLQEPLELPGFGKTQMIEIMEPRPHMVGKDIVGIDHVELLLKDLEEAASLMAAKGIKIGDGVNIYHHTVVVRINKKGQEIKFSNKPIETTLKEEMKAGDAYHIPEERFSH